MPGRVHHPPASVAEGKGTRSQTGGGSPDIAAFQAFVEQSDEGMILADESGIISWANPAAAALLGSSTEGLIGRNGFDLCRPEHLSQARDCFARCLSDSRQAVYLQVDARRGEGEFGPLVVRLLNRLDAAAIRAVVVYLRDATAPTADANQDREARDEPYRALFEDALVGLGVADIEGNLLAFNDAILEPGGYTRDDIQRIGKVERLYANNADRDRILGIARAQGLVWREAVQFRRKDGSFYDTLLTLTPVRFLGHPCWYATVEDVTERKRVEDERAQLEARLRQAQKMEAVGRMTSGIAHDFNNVLSIILVNADLMASELRLNATELRRELDELQAAAKRGTTMIQKLLGFSRNAPLNLLPTDLAALLTTLRGTLLHLLPGDISLELNAADECTAAVDPAAVEQMLMNLVTNARDAMGGSGVLRIEVRSVSLNSADLETRSWMTPGDYARLSVVDSGEGMDEATRARAFEPFFTTKPVGIGTGLGLPMVYGLVKQQQGFIDLESLSGHGTTVHLYFPAVAVKKAARSPVRAVRTARPGGDESILLIEDDDGVRSAARRVLERLGYRVRDAANGSTGVELYRRHRNEIDLVISDMMMPGLTGPEVYQAIRSENPAVRFLLSSGYRDAEQLGITISARLGLIRKPWTIDDIAQKVREMLDQQ
jgi:PAS domain S-box-containing protein